jgi:hypothetical protein
MQHVANAARQVRALQPNKVCCTQVTVSLRFTGLWRRPSPCPEVQELEHEIRHRSGTGSGHQVVSEMWINAHFRHYRTLPGARIKRIISNLVFAADANQGVLPLGVGFSFSELRLGPRRESVMSGKGWRWLGKSRALAVQPARLAASLLPLRRPCWREWPRP